MSSCCRLGYGSSRTLSSSIWTNSTRLSSAACNSRTFSRSIRTNWSHASSGICSTASRSAALDIVEPFVAVVDVRPLSLAQALLALPDLLADAFPPASDLSVYALLDVLRPGQGEPCPHLVQADR